MKIACFRCGGIIDTPGPTSVIDPITKKPTGEIYYNADYVMASDTITEELRTIFVARMETIATLKAKSEGKTVSDDDYDEEEVETVKDAVDKFGNDLFMVEAREVMKPIQKTGIVHPECHLPTDFVIWGAHKGAKRGSNQLL